MEPDWNVMSSLFVRCSFELGAIKVESCVNPLEFSGAIVTRLFSWPLFSPVLPVSSAFEFTPLVLSLLVVQRHPFDGFASFSASA
jgi:hypothetical protein